MSREKNILVPTFKNKGDIRSCTDYRGIKLMSHIIKLESDQISFKKTDNHV
jgi:hypothetical protein